MQNNNQFNAVKDLAINDGAIIKAAPAFEASAASPAVSSRYTFVSTRTAVETLRSNGWEVTAARSIRPRSAANIPFARHVITMRRKSDIGEQFRRSVGEYIPEMKIENSHGGDCAFIAHLALFRTACSNGVVIGESSFKAIRFVHLGLTQDMVIEAGRQMIEGFTLLGSLVGRMQRRILQPKEIEEFSVKAMLLRYPTLDAAPIEPNSVATQRRHEDGGQSLWLTFNRIQENVITGGLMGDKRDKCGRRRVMRGINSVRRQVSVNKGLWDLAAGYLN